MEEAPMSVCCHDNANGFDCNCPKDRWQDHPETLDRALKQPTYCTRDGGHEGPCNGWPKCCRVPPRGWYCTRGEGHDGPCAAYRSKEGWCPGTECPHYDGMLCDGSCPAYGHRNSPRPSPGPYDTGLQALIEALEAGHYAAPSSNLTEGSPLIVESLEATMKVVTFSKEALMPFRLRRYADMCARAAKWCRFFRLRSWEDLFKRAEASFIADYNHARAVIDSNRRQDPGGREPGAGPSSPQS